MRLLLTTLVLLVQAPDGVIGCVKGQDRTDVLVTAITSRSPTVLNVLEGAA